MVTAVSGALADPERSNEVWLFSRPAKYERALLALQSRARTKAAASDEVDRRDRGATDGLGAANDAIRPFSPAELARFRLTFDHFDADSSGELDREEFRRAMIDCGMIPTKGEVGSLFDEADKDRSGTISFAEYCRLVQVYRSKQSCLERLMESAMGCVTPRPRYLSDASLRFVRKMEHAGCKPWAIDAFVDSYKRLSSGSLLIPEADITPVDELPALEQIKLQPDPSLLGKTVLLKLNCRLGTAMGSDGPLSLQPVGRKEGLILAALPGGGRSSDAASAESVLLLDMAVQGAAETSCVMLFNSAATSAASMAHLRSAHPQLLQKAAELQLPIELRQSMAPKVTVEDLSPASWPPRRDLEWSPPGDGGVISAMSGSGALDKLLNAGFAYAFVSNAHDPVATLDQSLLTWFAHRGEPLLLEVARRTDSEREGAHFARRTATSGLLLRASAQCPENDQHHFDDVSRHRFRATDNLWLDLRALHRKLAKLKQGDKSLSVAPNLTTVDPYDETSTPVYELEATVGAVLELFGAEAAAILVPCSRFAPVRTMGDLLALRSDAYEAAGGRVVLAPEREGVPPLVLLDASYSSSDSLDALIPDGAPSLLRCTRLTIEGPFTLASGVVFEGDVRLTNGSGRVRQLPAGTYKDAHVRE